MKAIDTRYAGRRFRSRTEARWAVAFDAMQLDWDYEPEGYALASGQRYLPDFFIRFPQDASQAARWPGAGYWVEVKGQAPTARELRNLYDLACETKHIAYLVQGLPAEHNPVWIADFRAEEARPFNLPTFFIAPVEMLTPLKGPGRYKYWPVALEKALSARFEFGENGK